VKVLLFWSGIALLIFASLYGIVFYKKEFELFHFSSKQLTQSSLQDSVTSNNYIPLRFNQAGVMPIILTTAILVVPSYVSNLGLLPKLTFQ
jgi:preprotein translocase subunit SecY